MKVRILFVSLSYIIFINALYAYIQFSFTWSIYVWELAPQKFFSEHEPKKIQFFIPHCS